MLQPPVSDLAPWRPGHWITEHGYGLSEKDLLVGLRENPAARMDRQATVFEVDLIIERVMSE